MSKLLVVTLALEEALKGDDHAEVAALFRERDGILDAIESRRKALDPKSLEPIQSAEIRIAELLGDLRSLAVTELSEGARAKKAARAYRTRGSSAVAVDRVG